MERPTFLCDSDASVRTPLRARGGILPGFERDREGSWTGPYFFVQAADPQLGMFDQDRRWDRELDLMRRAAEHINRLRPRFVAVCGDEVNQVPGGPEYPAQVRDFLQGATGIDPAIPVICLPGNHDTGDTPTPETLEAWRRHFGDNWFAFWCGGVRYLVLDTTLYYDPSVLPEEQQRQEEWLEAELESLRCDPPTHVIVLQHHPWFLERSDDADQYFTIPRVRRDPALERLRRAGVRAVFAGHYHRNAYGRAGDMEMVTTSALGMPLGDDPSGFRIVEVYADRIAHRYYGLEEVPAVVTLAAD